MGRSVAVLTNGCPENRIDCARIEQFLRQAGWELEPNPVKADVIVLNTCGLTEFTQEASMRLLGELEKKKKQGATLLVCGCLPKINRDRIQAAYGGIVIEGDDVPKLSELLGIREAATDVHANYLVPATPSSPPLTWLIRSKLDWNLIPLLLSHSKYLDRLDSAVNVVQPHSYYIKVCSGCTNSCSYCAVKLSRGTVTSKTVEQVKAEFLEGFRAGYTQFSLLGSDLGSYGRDIQTDLVALLRELVAVDGSFSLKLRNVHPGYIIAELPAFLDVLSSGKVGHITTAIQHGNNRLLQLMKRGYNIGDCKAALNAVKSACPSLCIRTQLMVGFPGETEAEFNDVLSLVDEVPLDFVEVYKYSPRAGTAAAEMPGRVGRTTANRRAFLLNRKVLQYLRGQRGQLRP